MRHHLNVTLQQAQLERKDEKDSSGEEGSPSNYETSQEQEDADAVFGLLHLRGDGSN